MKKDLFYVLALQFLFNKQQFNYSIACQYIDISQTYFINLIKKIDLAYCDLNPGSGVIYDYKLKSYVIIF